MEKNEESNAKEILLENILDEFICLTTLNFISYGDNSINYAKACFRFAEFYLEYKNYPKQARKHCENGLDAMKHVISAKNNNETECNEVLMELYYIIGRASTILKKFVFFILSGLGLSLFFRLQRNTEGINYLEKAEKYFKEYEKTNNANVIEWKKKINMALAK